MALVNMANERPRWKHDVYIENTKAKLENSITHYIIRYRDK